MMSGIKEAKAALYLFWGIKMIYNRKELWNKVKEYSWLKIIKFCLNR